MKFSTKLAFVTAIGLALTGCKVESSPSTQEKGQAEQEDVMQRANNAVPTYKPRNFLAREAVQKWMQRMDVPDKTFYIYLLGDNGSHIGYYVGQTRPISSCTLMTPSQRMIRGDRGQYDGDFIVNSPNLNGTYGGGNCEGHYFFFDAATDALVEVSGMDFFVSDQPLNVDADPIQVQTQ